ncbi:MAG TPA: carbamoyltransferase [Chloroflexota bacterium]|nr:carbamoyltransferase [Chloroflexota bacterium]HUM69168.1 carbamoyltransferase [Chloroflexota bacterium]
MYILGISCFYHDAAAALLHDGQLVAAAEEERFSRQKHDAGFPHQAIAFCLQTAGITAHDLDYVVFYEKPLLKFERILKTQLSSFPRSWRAFGEAMIAWMGDKLWVKTHIQQNVGVPLEKILFVDHHLSHAASAFFASPFREAAVLTIDGVGEWTTAARGRGTAVWDGETGQNSLILSEEQRFPHSLGLLYSAFTAFLGFHVNSGEYKVMGMSPYGEPRYLDKLDKIFKVYDDGSFWTNMDYFSYHYSHTNTYNQKFIDLFGPPRIHSDDFFTTKTNPSIDPNEPQVKQNQHYADIAASIQLVTEEALLKLLRSLHQQTGLPHVCIAGGVGLNSKANGRILKETPFTDVFIQPAAGDSGGALGAALYVYHVLLGQPRRFVQEHNYWGAAYDDDAIEQAINETGFRHERIEDEAKLTETAVTDILQGKVIAWFQGRFEWGPRALGSRSIIADPRRAEMKEIINAKIKFREPFRPFAPVIIQKAVADYFEMVRPSDNKMAPFMLTVERFREGPGEQVPAVNHLGTGRLQSVRREWNPRYYDLVYQFGQATGVPILINTSFNLRGEPIVNTPANALKTFGHSDLDTLVMGNYVVRK